jgi:Carboxypeptidase regulatory-like domain
MKAALCLAMLFCWTAVAPAATPSGSISGTLFDSINDPVDATAVQAKNVASGAVFNATTSAAGKYTLADLPPGAYVITVNAPGLRPYEQKGVAVEASQVAKLDIHLADTTQLNTLGEDRTHQVADLKRHKPPSGPTPRTIDGKPDLSGVWWRTRTVDPGKPEFLPSAVAITQQRLESNNRDSPQAHCLPSGPLRNGPLWQFVQSKDVLVYISDDESPGFHQIYLDGRGHPADPNPSWYGHSIGKWEGDTLVVDRVGFDPRVWLDQESHPHSDKLHIIERYHRPDAGHLEIEITVDDPGILAKPWTQKRVTDLANEEIFEFICTENNKDVDHFVAK